MAELPDFATMDEKALEAAAHDLEERRLTAHVAFKAEGMAIAARRNELAASAGVSTLSPEERVALRKALDALDALGDPQGALDAAPEAD